VGRIGTAMAPCARHRHPSSPLTHTTAGTGSVLAGIRLQLKLGASIAD
jgi:hypothetical protein